MIILAQFKPQNQPRYPGVYYLKKKSERKGTVLVGIPEKTSFIHIYFSGWAFIPVCSALSLEEFWLENDTKVG